MLESWFFYDLAGICKYIGLRCTKTLQKRYSNPEQYDCKDLADLFRKGSKRQYYKKGDKGFINNLNLDLIYNHCKTLQKCIEMINLDFK